MKRTENPRAVPDQMLAMRIHRIAPLLKSAEPLARDRVAVPTPGQGEVLLRVEACGVCHTELDELEGRTPPPHLPVTPGHQVAGRIVASGPGCAPGLEGLRVGVAWIHSACGECAYCRDGLENLCPRFVACGRDADGGYAEYMVASEKYVYRLPQSLDYRHAAPLLCAGAVGYRALSLCRLPRRGALGLTGFGASGHLVLKMARHLYPESTVFVYTRNRLEQEFALELGADWAGGTEDHAPGRPAAIIDTTPAWKPVRAALAELAPGGRLVINAIRKEDTDQRELLNLKYEQHLWREKSIQSVANVTREDVRRCLELAEAAQLAPEITTYPLAEANRALLEIKQGGLRGAKVLVTG